MSRYIYAVIVARIAAAVKARNAGAKEIYQEVGITKDKWSRKMRGRGSSFTLEELGAIADALQMPLGWPFVEAPKVTDIPTVIDAKIDPDADAPCACGELALSNSCAVAYWRGGYRETHSIRRCSKAAPFGPKRDKRRG